MIIVLHNPDFIEWGFSSSEEHLQLQKMTPVAVVYTDTLEIAYSRTQHITSAWWATNFDTVLPFVRGRSTSVGDVLIRIKGQSAQVFVVHRFGFEEVGSMLPQDVIPPAEAEAEAEDLEGPEPDGPFDDPPEEHPAIPEYGCPICDHITEDPYVHCPACGAWTGWEA